MTADAVPFPVAVIVTALLWWLGSDVVIVKEAEPAPAGTVTEGGTEAAP